MIAPQKSRPLNKYIFNVYTKGNKQLVGAYYVLFLCKEFLYSL